MKKIFLIIAILLSVSGSLSFAQSENKLIHISIGAKNNFNKNDFHHYWEAGIGFGSEFRFEHAIGEIGGGLSIMRFDKKIDSAKSFYGIDYYFLYRNSFRLIENAVLILGFDAGIFEFRFDDDGDIQSSAEKIEREFTIKIMTGLSYAFNDSWKVELTTAYNHIYTKKKIELFYLNLGLVKSFSVPEWLKDFLE
jgi:opacity protein-like surface antigen